MCTLANCCITFHAVIILNRSSLGNNSLDDKFSTSPTDGIYMVVWLVMSFCSESESNHTGQQLLTVLSSLFKASTGKTMFNGDSEDDVVQDSISELVCE